MPSWNLPPPPGGDPAAAVENAVNTAVDGAGDVVDAVVDAVQDNASSPTTPAAPGPIPIPYPNVVALGPALQGFGDFAMQTANEVFGVAETSVSSAAGIVSETLSRVLPVVIGVLGSAGRGGVGPRVSELIGRLASAIDRLFATLAPQPAAASDGARATAADAASGLRELGLLLLRDAQWQRANLQERAARLSGKPRPRRTRPIPAAQQPNAADAARVQRVLARLSLLDAKLQRLEAQLTARGPAFTADARAMTRLRASLQTVQRAGGLPPRR
jgi:hypothetical protein